MSSSECTVCLGFVWFYNGFEVFSIDGAFARGFIITIFKR